MNAPDCTLLQRHEVKVRVILELFTYAVAHCIYTVGFYIEQSAYVDNTHSYKKAQ